jgi:3-keto-disaccharide hydrolase
MRIRSLLVGALISGVVSPALAQDATSMPQSPNVITAAEKAAGWQSLFDGVTTHGWRGYQKKTMPAGWVVEDGTLTRAAPGGDIITDKQYKDFELALEWKISEGGNSGIMFHVTEGAEDTYETGPEMQVLDDARHADGHSRLTSAGAAYGLYPSPAGIVKPAGEWNQIRLLVKGHHVEHWLNGVKVVEYELQSPDWEAKVAASKFKQWPGYGRALKGYIALQDHGDRVWYRSIKIRDIR